MVYTVHCNDAVPSEETDIRGSEDPSQAVPPACVKRDEFAILWSGGYTGPVVYVGGSWQGRSQLGQRSCNESIKYADCDQAV